MTDLSKVKPSHSARQAFIYVRQSSVSQVEHNRESTARQYALGDRAQQLGWPKDNIVIIDDDLGLSGSTTNKRSGFARMISEVALGHVGMILGLEVSRLARNNADWYRLLELCGLTVRSSRSFPHRHQAPHHWLSHNRRLGRGYRRA